MTVDKKAPMLALLTERASGWVKGMNKWWAQWMAVMIQLDCLEHNSRVVAWLHRWVIRRSGRGLWLLHWTQGLILVGR